MSRTVAADPVELVAGATEVERRMDDVRAVGARVDAALRAFRDGSSELVPVVAEHAATIESLADRGELLAEGIVGTARRIHDADGGMSWLRLFPGTDQLGRFAGPGVLAVELFELHSDVSDAVDVATTARAAQLAGSAQARTWWVARRWGPGTTIPMPVYRAVTGSPIGVASNRTLAPLKRAQELANAATRADAAADVGRARELLRGLHVSSFADDVATLADDAASTMTRLGGAARAGGTVLGGVGVAVSLGGAVGHVDDGEWGDAASDAANAAGSLMLMTGAPPVQIAGAVLVAGSLVYEHREAIVDAGETVVETAGDLLDGARSLLGGLF